MAVSIEPAIYNQIVDLEKSINSKLAVIVGYVLAKEKKSALADLNILNSFDSEFNNNAAIITQYQNKALFGYNPASNSNASSKDAILHNLEQKLTAK